MKRLMFCFIVAVFCTAYFKASGYQTSSGFKTGLGLAVGTPHNDSISASASNAARPEFQTSFASSKQHIQTHAASLVELKDGRIRAFWFSGSREGAADVEIHGSVFDPATGYWGKEQAVVTRENTEHSLMRYISKLGNPVAGRASDGSLWLYFVTVSMGGWAGSSISVTTSLDEGETWQPARRLVTSPFLNISTLVKGAPFFYADGSIGLPVYHEFISKFGEILHFDQTDKLIDKQRLSAGKDHGLQPLLLPGNVNQAQVLMRHSGDEHRQVICVSTSDGGKTWTRPEKISLSNPDAALAAVSLQDGRLLAVLNNQEQGRDTLSLMISADGGASWLNLYQLEDQRGHATDEAHYLNTVAGLVKQVAATEAREYTESAKNSLCTGNACRFEFSYPYLIQTQGGNFHLVYTWNRSFIKHVTFTRAWLNQRLKLSGHD
jgi:predicted neuraminidase